MRLLEHVRDRLLHGRGSDDGGHRDPLVAVDVAVHSGQIKECGAEGEDEEEDDEAERQEQLLADRQVPKPTIECATHGVRYHSRCDPTRWVRFVRRGPEE